MKELQIRVFEPEDAGDVSRLIIRNLREVLIRDYSPAAMDALAGSYTPTEILTESRHQLTLVALMGDVIAGTASLQKNRIRNVFVDPDRHRMGIGKALMAATEKSAREDGCGRIYLMAGISAGSFYEKQGFRVIDYIEHDLGGVPIPEIYMEKIFDLK